MWCFNEQHQIADLLSHQAGSPAATPQKKKWSTDRRHLVEKLGDTMRTNTPTPGFTGEAARWRDGTRTGARTRTGTRTGTMRGDPAVVSLCGGGKNRSVDMRTQSSPAAALLLKPRTSLSFRPGHVIHHIKGPVTQITKTFLTCRHVDLNSSCKLLTVRSCFWRFKLHKELKKSTNQIYIID